MKVICKVCGYVTAEKHLKDVCPACGVKKSAFEPYNDKVKPGRRKLLDLKIHAMSIHFPQAIALLVFFLIFVSKFAGMSLLASIQPSVRVLAVLLPFSVAASLVSGVFDGKIRLKRFSTPILKFKMILAVFFLLVSVVLLLVVMTVSNPSWILLTVLSGTCALVSMILGKKGGTLIGVEVPG